MVRVLLQVRYSPSQQAVIAEPDNTPESFGRARGALMTAILQRHLATRRSVAEERQYILLTVWAMCCILPFKVLCSYG